MKSRPVRPDLYRLRMERLKQHAKPLPTGFCLLNVEPLAVHELRSVLAAYYGSETRAAIVILKESFWLWRVSTNTRFVCWFSDAVGWTVWYDYPETETQVAHSRRHGRRCSPNCGDMDCVDKAWPRWFRFLANMGTGR